LSDKIIIKNLAGVKREFNLVISEKLKEIISLSEDNFELGPGEEKTVYIKYAVSEEMQSETYIGEIEVTSNNQKKVISIVSSVNTKNELFDVNVEINSGSKSLFAGDDLYFNTVLFNMGETGRIDALVQILIRDLDDNILIRKEETIAVETQASFSRSIRIPNDFKTGEYVLSVAVFYSNLTASSSDTFNVKNKNILFNYLDKKYLFIGGVILVALFAIVIFVVIILIVIKFVKKGKKKNAGINKKGGGGNGKNKARRLKKDGKKVKKRVRVRR
jgi:uncharacterized membrane protein